MGSPPPEEGGAAQAWSTGPTGIAAGFGQDGASQSGRSGVGAPELWAGLELGWAVEASPVNPSQLSCPPRGIFAVPLLCLLLDQAFSCGRK